MRKLILISLLSLACLHQGFDSQALANGVCFQCHEKVSFSGKVIHEPVKELKCSICHNPHVARHKGLLRSREDKLCYTCHKNEKESFAKGIVHEPVAKGNCSACHAPHASEDRGLIQGKLADACFSCHDKLPQSYSNIHKPFAEGKCTVCHTPHQADNLRLLADKPDALCSSCHKKDEVQKGHPDYPDSIRDCLSCHNPHGSERTALVRNNLHEPYEKGCAQCHDEPSGTSMATCLKCHENVQKQMLQPRNHLTLHNGNSCLNCHSPHAGDTPSLLKGRERQICASCHEDTMKGHRESLSRHPSIKKCSSCHESHGGRYLSMLRGNGNDVCIQCHEDQGTFTHPVGPEVLDTHTGQMITCVSCHDPMGSEHKYHLVAEGKKALCIRCHRAY